MTAGGFSTVGIFIFVLIATVIVIMIAYSCKRPNHHTPRTFPGPELWTTNPTVAMDVEDPTSNRLDRATLISYPKLLYAETKLRHKDTTATCCSICLADYKEDDVLRLLPECEHLFHLKCVDPWLLLHPTCPVCRTSPLPSPSATPLAEVAPLVASM